MLGIQLLLALFALFALVRTLRQWRAGQLPMAWSLLWGGIWLGALVLIWLPNTAQWVANHVGVGRGVDLVIYVALAALFYIQFRVLVKIESIEQELSMLVRKIALEEKNRS